MEGEQKNMRGAPGRGGTDDGVGDLHISEILILFCNIDKTNVDFCVVKTCESAPQLEIFLFFRQISLILGQLFIFDSKFFTCGAYF